MFIVEAYVKWAWGVTHVEHHAGRSPEPVYTERSRSMAKGGIQRLQMNHDKHHYFLCIGHIFVDLGVLMMNNP